MTKRKSKQPIIVRTLERALSRKRPHNSFEVSTFTSWLFDNLPTDLRSFCFTDKAGNLHVDNRFGKSKTLFIAHVDTVHRVTGVNKIRKTQTHWYADGAPLGADDGAGCAMLMHLIHSGVHGYYIFSQGEECGGIGAKFVSKDVNLLSQFDRAIAFDRRGIDSVISHQGWGRCASDTFCNALADELNMCDANLMYMPDDTGVYTDTAEFVDVIPECTNISVGYNSEHSQQESLNIHHFELLSRAVLAVNWDGLPTERDPSEPEYKTYTYDTGGTAWWTKYDSTYDTKANRSLEQSRYFSKWEDDEYWQTEDLLDGLYDAMVGHCDFLLEQISEAVYPEQPDLALRFLDRKLLTDDLLQEALIQARTYDAATVLCTLFDAIHCEA